MTLKKLFRLHNKRLWHNLSAVIVLAMVLSACGGAATAQPTVMPETPAGSEPTSAAPTEAIPLGPEGALRVAMQPIVQTDPAFISSDSEVLVANHVYDYLVDIDAKSSIQPRLATSWTSTPDGRSYTFTLAEGVTFHDGSPFTAADVVWTFNRLRDPALESPTTDLYKNIESIEATGDHEVTFQLTQPNPFFLYDLSDNHALILKANTEDPAQFNGTGPFRVQQYTPEDRIQLVANEDYFVEGQPKLAELEIIFFNDETAMADALRGGQVDLMMRMSTAMYESLQAEPGIVTVDIPTNGFDLVRLRADREPGNDPRVVEALKLATDREAIFDLVQQGYGAIGRDSPIGPLYAAYYSEETPLPERDPQRARDLLADAGYPNGLEMDLHTPDTGGRPDLAAVLADQWAEAGIRINVIVEPESVYYGDNGWLEVNLGITGWGSRPYPQFYLDTMLRSDAVWNEAHWSDAELDQLIATAGTTLNENERAEAYQEIQRILIERGPIIIPYFFAQFAAHSEGIEGFELKAFAGRTDLRPVSISE